MPGSALERKRKLDKKTSKIREATPSLRTQVRLRKHNLQVMAKFQKENDFSPYEQILMDESIEEFGEKDVALEEDCDISEDGDPTDGIHGNKSIEEFDEKDVALEKDCDISVDGDPTDGTNRITSKDTTN